MIPYRINPYISFIESRLFPETTQYAVFHRLTGEIQEPSQEVRSLLHAAKLGNRVSFTAADPHRLGELGNEISELIRKEFLIAEDYDPLTHLPQQYVVRPIQNPALMYRSQTGEWILVRTSMEQTVYSRKRNDLPLVVEEKLTPLIAEIFLLADGTRTLQQIFSTLCGIDSVNILEDSEFRAGIDFLTSQERQLIKFTSHRDGLDDPFSVVNIVPRNLYHSNRWEQDSADNSENIIDFHLRGIEDASWEFDWIEPTVNHCFRFPSEALGGLSYGARFCLATLRPEVLSLMDRKGELNVLEVGGGTGSFARSFIEQASKLSGTHSNGPAINYHILDVSPALMEGQRKTLSGLLPDSRHFHQDATEFDLPGRTFDLIIANEVIADFPVAAVKRKPRSEFENDGDMFEGDGAHYVDKYNLSSTDAPDSFLVNSGAFRFVERAWKHLNPGGSVIISEYGAEDRYPARAFQLNHDEFTIHFGHVAACGAKVGFACRLLTLKEFLSFDDELLVLNGREEHIMCMDHVLKNFGLTLPYAVISKSAFERQYQTSADEISLTGYSFLPLKSGYHFGPNIKDFLVLIMNKPQ